MDWLPVILSGLVGALLGSVLSLLGAFCLERWRRHQEELGAARALYFEMTSNAAELRRASEGRPFVGLTHATWEVAQSKVATLLSPSAFMKIALSYAILPHCEARIDSARARGVATPQELAFWRDSAIGVLDGVIALQGTVWSQKEWTALQRADDARSIEELGAPDAGGSK